MERRAAGIEATCIDMSHPENVEAAMRPDDPLIWVETNGPDAAIGRSRRNCQSHAAIGRGERDLLADLNQALAGVG